MLIEVQVEGESDPRRYRVTRQDQTIRLRRDTPDAEELVIDWRRPEDRVYSLLIGALSYDIHIDEDEHDEEQLLVHLLSHVLAVRASDARRRRTARTESSPDGLVRMTAPMPGKVVKVLSAEGTAVHRGDGIIVLEAMKMENELKAPRDGIVTRIEVQEGQGVVGGALLATIE